MWNACCGWECPVKTQNFPLRIIGKWASWIPQCRQRWRAVWRRKQTEDLSSHGSMMSWMLATVDRGDWLWLSTVSWRRATDLSSHWQVMWVEFHTGTAGASYVCVHKGWDLRTRPAAHVQCGLQWSKLSRTVEQWGETLVLVLKQWWAYAVDIHKINWSCALMSVFYTHRGVPYLVQTLTIPYRANNRWL